MANFFRSIIQSISKRKGLFFIFIIAAIVMIVLGVIAAINYDSGVLPIDLTNIPYIKFLRGDSGFFSMILNTIIACVIVYLIIVLCCCKKYLVPIAVIFYLYLIYSMGVIFTSIILIYGFFSSLILLVLLLVYFGIQLFVFTAILCELLYINKHMYFKTCFSWQESVLIYLSLILLITILTFCFILTFLKNYIILLLYQL